MFIMASEPDGCMDKKIFRYFGLSKLKAEQIARDSEKVFRLLKIAAAKARKNPSLIRFTRDLNTSLRMLSAWLRGEYTQIPWRTIISLLGALIYFINPLDAVPDIIPAYGLVDDITVLGFVFNSVRNDLADFEAWESSQMKQKTLKRGGAA